VWPETATDLDGPDPALDAAVRAIGVPAVIGARYRLPDRKAINALVTWDPAKGEGPRYAKRELVPFAEYIPMRPIASLVTPFVNNTVDMRTGDSPGVLDVAGTRIGVAICYEAAYDYVARDAVNAGAQLLIVPTNNAWYGPGEMSYQQLAQTRLRAVEHGRAVVVAATSGVSAIVEADGSVRRQTGLFTAAELV